MTSRKRLLLIGGKPEHLQVAHATGADIVYCQFEEKFQPEQAALVEEAILTDYTNWDTLRPLIQAAHEKWEFSAIASLTEPGLDPAARGNDLLGLGGTSYEVSHRFTNKWLMRRQIAVSSLDVPTVKAALVTDRDSLVKFGAEYGYPFIVKPTSGTASFSIRKVTGAASVDSAWHMVRQLRAGPDHPLAHSYDMTEFIMEEFVDGPMCSAEAFSFNGHHVVMTITEAIMLDSGYVHVGHAIPARIDPSLEAAVVEATTNFLDAMGLRDGPSHTEFKLSPHGPVVIESHNRIGGAQIHKMIQSVYGLNPQPMTFGWPLGLMDALQDWPAPKGGAASWLLVAEPGRVLEVRRLEEVSADPTTLMVDLWVSPGDLVRPLDGQWDGLGHVVSYAADTTSAIGICRENLAKLEVCVEK